MRPSRPIWLLFVALVPARAFAEGPCDHGFVLKQGAVIESTRFNATHQPIGKVVGTIVQSETKDGVTRATMSVDNYIGANKASTSNIDYVCDGKTVSMNSRNAENFKFFAQAVKASGKNMAGGYNETTPQVYPLEMKVGDTLPPWRSVTLMVTPEKMQSFQKLYETSSSTTYGIVMVERNVASGTQMVTRDIKVVGQETCSLPGGKTSPCFHINKHMFSSAAAKVGDLNTDLSQVAKGAPVAQTIDEWFVPGVGVVKLTIGLNGRTILSMEVTNLKIPD